MKEKLSIQKHFSRLKRFTLICGLVIAVTCVGPASLAQGNYQHHHHNKIYTIGVDASASGPLFNLLSRYYSIAAMDTVTPPSNLHPVVIGPDALENQDVTAYLVHAYRAGLTVGIAYATPEQANRFEQLVEGEQAASCAPTSGTPRMALYAVQRTTQEEPEEVSRYCLPTVLQASPRTEESDDGWMGGEGRDHRSGEGEEQWLSATFSPQAPPPPLQSVDAAAGNSVNLDSLSRKTHCSEFHENAKGQIQDDIFVTSLRNFDSQRDYYYVQNFTQYNSRVAVDRLYAFGSQPYLKLPGSGKRGLSGTRLLFSEPATTTSYVSEYTNDRSSTISASVGYSGGFPEVSVSKSITVGSSTKVIVPPVTIRNTSELATAGAYWEFHPANPRPNVLYSTATSWVWYIDRDVYGNTPNEIPEVFSDFMFGNVHTLATAVCGFPPPFPTFSIGAPEITSVNPEAVQRGGGTFLIHGEHMYPGILRNVLLGGDALPPANIVPINDKEIRVVVPSSQNTGPNPIQVNTSFNGGVLPSNSDINVNVK